MGQFQFLSITHWGRIASTCKWLQL